MTPLTPALNQKMENLRRNLFTYLEQVDENGDIVSKEDDILSGKEDEVHPLPAGWRDFSATVGRLRKMDEMASETKDMLATIRRQMDAYKQFWSSAEEMGLSIDEDEESLDDNEEDFFRVETLEGEQDDDENLLEDHVNEETIWRQALQDSQETRYVVKLIVEEGETKEASDDVESMLHR